MPKDTLYNVAKRYITIIEAIEKSDDRFDLMLLEEQRVICHNKLIRILKHEGIPYHDREQVTRMAYQIVKEYL